MHILVVTQYFWPENFRINDLVAALTDRGHQVTVLTGIPNYPEGKFYFGYSAFHKLEQVYAGARVVRVPIVPRGNGGAIWLLYNYISFVVSACLCGLPRCRDRYDLTFIFEPSPITVAVPAIFLKALRKIPVMFWVQDLWPESLTAAGAVTSPRIIDLVAKLVRFIYDRCDNILVTSRAFVPSIVRFSRNTGHIYYFPQYSEQLYCPLEVPGDAAERSLLPTGFIIMFAGNIGVAQDFGTILSAAERLRHHKDIHFVVLGDGRARKWVEEEVTRLELKETFHILGRYPLEAMPTFFALADAMLVTLKKDPIFSLTIPAKIQSYLACGKPIVAALEGEGANIINEASAGVTCPTENPEALAAAILQVRDLPDEVRCNMGDNGLRYYQDNFDRSMLLDRLEKWMEQLRAETGGKA